jgi:hypothetical protein
MRRPLVGVILLIDFQRASCAFSVCFAERLLDQFGRIVLNKMKVPFAAGWEGSVTSLCSFVGRVGPT